MDSQTLLRSSAKKSAPRSSLRDNLFGEDNHVSGSPYKLGFWRVLVFWKKLIISKKKKRKSKRKSYTGFEGRVCCESLGKVLPYDELSYSRNFDQGFAWDDHDDEPDHDHNLSRSFSFRFSNPSNVDNYLCPCSPPLIDY